MKIYVTRHGQVDYSGQDQAKGDVVLSDTGCIQAKLLGQALKELGFCGPVFASPYKRTLMTAQSVAKVCGSKIYPQGALREFFFSDEAARNFQGMRLRDMQDSFSAIAPEAVLEYPWWEPQKDDYSSIAARAGTFWPKVLEGKHQEMLAVCHDASVLGFLHFFNQRLGLGFPEDFPGLVQDVMNKDLNCELSCMELDEKGNLISAAFFMTWFLPEEYLTINGNRAERPEARVFPFRHDIASAQEKAE